MKVEIWADVVCPWCGLGQRRLESALAAFAHRAEVEIVHRSFQLDPGFPAEPMPVREMLKRKYGLTDAQVAESTARVEQLAAAEGIRPYHVGDNHVGNTRLAHELLALAGDRGLSDVAWKRMYAAYFGDRRPIFDLDTLVALGGEIGLDPDEVREALVSGRYRSRVEADAREAQQLGARGVPFVVIDRKVGISGAQPTATFLRALERARVAA